jgi:hypothetical protein
MRESLIRKFEQRMVAVETRLTRLECPHERVEFRENESPFWFDGFCAYRYKICCACKKVLEVYLTRESWLAAKADQAEEELINMRQELDKERAANDTKAKKAKA